jgi:hypothetical protein
LATVRLGPIRESEAPIRRRIDVVDIFPDRTA